MHQDPQQTCPYNSSHRVARSRMPFHLVKCRQNNKCYSDKKQCPYDARHIINPIEFNYHVKHCESRETVMHYALRDEEESRYQNILPIVIESAAAPTDENWDDEPEVRSYNPENNIQNRAVVRTTIGLSKARRREFKMAERRRIQALDAINERKEKIAAQVPKADDNDNEYKPLRRPKKRSDTLNSSALSMNSSIVSAAGEKPSQQKKPMPESQAKANTSVELNEYKPLRRPNMPPADTLNKPASSSSRSISSIARETSTLQKKPTFANASALSTSSKSTQKADTPAPNAAPFSYAAALSRNKNSDNFDSIVEEERYDSDKENTTNNSFLSHTRNDSIIDKISKTVAGLNMDDAAHKKKTEPLNKEIEKLKTLKKNSNSNTDKKYFKRGADFPELK